MAKVGFIGLGVMGFPMAGHLSKNGHKITVYNRSPEKSKAWCENYSGVFANSPAEVASNSDYVFSCVGNDDDLESVTLGTSFPKDYGAFARMKKGTYFIDHTTASAEVTRKLYKISQENEFSFIDAPVSGGQAGAENGSLTVMCGGDKDAYSAVEPLIRSFSNSCKLMGESGAGQLTKMVNQICIAGLLQGLSEGLSFASNAKLNVKDVIEVIKKGAAGSWQMDNRGHTMSDNLFDFGFAVDWMRKDLKICLDEADKNGSSLPVTSIVDQFYKQIQKSGGGRLDTSSLIKLLK